MSTRFAFPFIIDMVINECSGGESCMRATGCRGSLPGDIWHGTIPRNNLLLRTGTGLVQADGGGRAVMAPTIRLVGTDSMLFRSGLLQDASAGTGIPQRHYATWQLTHFF